jgi:hypothetical protein
MIQLLLYLPGVRASGLEVGGGADRPRRLGQDDVRELQIVAT